MMAVTVSLHVNDQTFTVSAAPDTPLLYILRNDLALNGPKFGCGLGECGACTVLVNGKAVRSCVIPLRAVREHSVTTLEGLGTAENLHPVQSAFIAENAAQCGYCLNGMIMAVVGLLERNSRPNEQEIRAALRHNLCRCGTHIEILAAARRAVEMVHQAGTDRSPAP